MTTAAAPTIADVSSDPYANASSQHATQVEPDSFAFGTTIVAAAQTGRFTNGGASNVCYARSGDSGVTWTQGCLPRLTVFSSPAGTYDRVSDPAVAYAPEPPGGTGQGTWFISTLGLKGTSSVSGAAVLVSRSTDGGLTWGNPIVVSAAKRRSDYDKNWIVCDTWGASPYRGRCYVTWDDYGNGNRLLTSVSTNAGVSWGAPQTTGNSATGLGGQPVVQPSGTVVVPSANANETTIIAYRSTNGGTSWSNPVTISAVSRHAVAGSLRSGPLPSAEVDAAGRVYVVWQDCRFRTRCASNDIVMSTSDDGVTWSAVTRIPIDDVTSTVDHFIPGLAVDPATSAATGGAHLGLTSYAYPQTNCSSATCSLTVSFISSKDGGATWSAPVPLVGGGAAVGAMSLSWLPSTTQGTMVGDYISTSFLGGLAFPFFCYATAKSGTTFAERLATVPGGISVDVAAATASGLDRAVASAAPQVSDTTPIARQ